MTDIVRAANEAGAGRQPGQRWSMCVSCVNATGKTKTKLRCIHTNCLIVIPPTGMSHLSHFKEK